MDNQNPAVIPSIPQWCKKVDDRESSMKMLGSILAWGGLIGIFVGFRESTLLGILAIVAVIGLWALKLTWRMKSDPFRDFEKKFPAASMDRTAALAEILRYHRGKNLSDGISSDKFRACASLKVYQHFTGGEYQSGPFTIKNKD